MQLLGDRQRDQAYAGSALGDFRLLITEGSRNDMIEEEIQQLILKSSFSRHLLETKCALPDINCDRPIL